ncbi:hypothetical protein GP486_003652 [Trichoglossum hirsutum]|uniref:Uncharacterized protein n=1 Tax=Trichoglossum hirsutum TaxID=265104 RepID=A0A9P8LCM8_9PEZI|nr:hypothetical protein GP486_003652 [Trichoglossum hirsutum]
MTQWARAFIHSEELSLYLATQSNSIAAPEDQPRHLQDLELISDGFKDLLSAGHDILDQELTDSEKSFIELQSLLAGELKSILGAGSSLKKVVVDGLQKATQQFDAKLESLQATSDLAQEFQRLDVKGNGASGHCDRLLSCIPDWRFLHESYITVEELNSISAYTKYVDMRSKVAKSGIPKNATSVAKQRIESVYEANRSRAADIKNRLSESGVVSALVDRMFGRDGEEDGGGGIGVAVEDLVGESWMENHVARVVDSWQEALDGVLRVKVH